MTVSNKIDNRMIVLVIIALIGGVIGGFLSNVSMKGTKFEGLSDYFSAQLITKDTEIASLSKTMSELEQQISQLEVSIADVESVPVIGFNTPDYDSGWVDRQLVFVDIHHNLGSTNLFVYLIGGSSDIQCSRFSGGDLYLDHNIDDNFMSSWAEKHYGVYWITIDENTIRVMWGSDETGWPEIRMLLWLLPEPPVNWNPVS